LQEIWYTITERFDSSFGDSWINYINWSKLTQLRRVISVDSSLNPKVIEKYNDEDWLHNIKADYLTDYFNDLDYLTSRIQISEKLNLLAVILEPKEDVSNLIVDKDFVFLGYDLAELVTSTSALTNCGGFEKSFNNSELSENGLIKSYSRAKEIQESLKINYPEEEHANCIIWAIWIRE
jgi:hypothetical protein